MESSNFCTGCGKELEPGMQFCPQCGLVVSGSAADEEFKEKQKMLSGFIKESRRNWLVFLLGIYAFPVIIAAIITLIDASSVASAVWSSSEFQDWIQSHGYSYTESDIKNYITYAACLALASGICAAISMTFTCLRKNWIIAVAGCFMAAVLCFWSVFGIIIGFLVLWMLITSRDLFEDAPAEAEPTE